MGKEGFRETPATCLQCPDKTSCLQTALKTDEGFKRRREVLDRSPAEGFVARLRRWSDRKELSRLNKLYRGKKK